MTVRPCRKHVEHGIIKTGDDPIHPEPAPDAPNLVASPVVRVRWCCLGRRGEDCLVWPVDVEIVTSKGTRIVTDPHNLEAYRVKPMKADLVLMSHFHNDHTQTSVIENLKDAKQFNVLKKTGPGGAVQEWNAVDEKVKDVHIRTLGTFHDAMSGLQRARTACGSSTWTACASVHLGDLGHLLDKWVVPPRSSATWTSS